ncbi:transcription initiation factor TFIID subunit A-domain-containing protein [Mycena pura]|uniref:TBP-associated factor 12 n=1 Tax=Mycena pura TaxID=153505 RepID=A0AAD6YEP1_9AGAR|nr:transcription initiation factor TFIID subunit A-domain-containing protein [Mycena pura]
MDGQAQPPSGTQNSQELLAEFISLISSGDKAKEGLLQQKLEEIIKTGGMTHEAMFKKLQQIQAEQARAKANKPGTQGASTSAAAVAAAAAAVLAPQPSHPAFKSTVDESPFLSSSSLDASAYPISGTLNVATPASGAYGTAPVRPTLTGGHAAGRISGTPAQFAREEPIPLSFTADHRTQSQARKNTPGDLSMRRTIHDLVASVDPNVKIEPEVEDLLLSIADEFIDSVTNFSCRLAKHRGGEALEVRDLQLHLERNHNIRIPGFASDDTRISLSQSSIMPAAAPAAAPKKTAQGTHMTLRSQRLAQVQQAKREAKLM